ncbi:MAG: CBS domain-containing protein [Candidatus Bathyarchaeota archaeon]|nr:CBS domain-containing protein [Candidatus Bathyarchaeota archaeon]
MGEKDILKFLQNLGFSKREVQVYMFLAKSGAQSTSFVAKRLKMERVQAYRTFKKLQEKGFIEATLERPTRFTVVPFSNLLETFIEAKKVEVENLNEQKENLMNSWRTVSAPESDYTVAKFSVISGKKKIHSKMLNMVDEAQKDVYVLTTGLGVIQEDLGGVFDATVDVSRAHKVNFKIIADISRDNFRIMERLEKRVNSEKADIETRHLNLNARYFPRFLIKDEEEAILYASSGDEASILNIEDEGLWINDKMFISILKAFFSQMWHIGIEADRRIEELKTGVPIGETTVIKDPEEAWRKVVETLGNAKEDVILITSSQSLISLLEKDPFEEHHKEGVKFRLMAPIDLDNLEAAKKLSSAYEIKHVPINYMTMMLVDDRNLFMFKSAPLNDVSDESFFYLNDTFFTNDKRSSERVREMLTDTWKRGVELSEITSQAAGMKLPSVNVSTTGTVAQTVDIMLRNNVNQVIVTQNGAQVGILSDRDILKEVLKNKKNLESGLVKDLDYTPLLALSGQQTMTDALKIIREKGNKRIAVAKDGQLMGMLTQDMALKSVVTAKSPR